MTTINPYDYWEQNWKDAKEFFESKGNTMTLIKLKNKWYNNFMKIFSDIAKYIRPTNKSIKEILRLLKKYKCIDDGEFNRIWNDWKNLTIEQFKDNE